LKDKTIALLFEKASTRTRVSFEVGVLELGGHTIYLSSKDTQLSRGEPLRDTARVLSRYVHGIVVRTFRQQDVEELARFSSVPVINGLSDSFHPCQILSDLFTIKEFGKDLSKAKIAFVGDGNNVANSWVEAAILLDLHLSVATPPAYMPEASLLERARKNRGFHFTTDPKEAVRDADVINTDVWVSMGEKETAEKKKAFEGYSVNEELLAHAKKDAIVMHCLPAKRGEEIEDAVLERFADVIFTQSENRLHVQKALLEWLLGGRE
jgi:ornithine carbamoyltransferase